jgi:hypothetical protein
MSCNGTPLRLHNCTRLRVESCALRCTLLGSVSDSQCAACPVRTPIMSMGRADKRRIRGLGDLVELCIWALFLGRLDIAQRLASGIGRLLGAGRHAQAQRKGCGCKARKQALNRAIPFR